MDPRCLAQWTTITPPQVSQTGICGCLLCRPFDRLGVGGTRQTREEPFCLIRVAPGPTSSSTVSARTGAHQCRPSPLWRGWPLVTTRLTDGYSPEIEWWSMVRDHPSGCQCNWSWPTSKRFHLRRHGRLGPILPTGGVS